MFVNSLPCMINYIKLLFRAVNILKGEFTFERSFLSSD